MQIKKILLTAFLIILLGATNNAKAAIITSTLSEFSSPIPTQQFSSWITGQFNYVIPDGEQIINAVITGQWGNNTNPTSAHNQLSLDGIIIANSTNNTIDSYFIYNTPWQYTFSGQELSVFNDGSATFNTQMLSPTVAYYTYQDEFNTPITISYFPQIRLAATTLQLTSAPAPVPEPSSMILGIISIGSMLGLRRKK